MFADFSFHDFLRLILIRMFDQKIPLPQNELIWQRFFYKLKKEMGGLVPLFKMRFNWDGPRPHSRIVEGTLQSFRCFDLITTHGLSFEDGFNPAMIAEWRKDFHLSAEEDATIQKLMDLLKKEFDVIQDRAVRVS